MVGSLAAWQLWQDHGRSLELVESAHAEAAAPAAGHFNLVDHNGNKVTDADYAGKYRLVYFGFTYCPDMCPTGLQSMSRAMDLLGDKAAKVQPLFITIDPERDTPAVMKDYVSNFHPSIIGLTGTHAEVDAAAKAYNVYYKKAEQVDDDNYMMDHSTIIFLISPEGKFIEAFKEDVDPKLLIDALKKSGLG